MARRPLGVGAVLVGPPVHVWRALERSEITIAFPQLDVHFDAKPRIDRAA